MLKTVPDNPALKVINLSNNKIKSLGFSVLLDLIAFHPSLESVYLDNNFLDVEALISLKKQIQKIKNLKLISMRNNRGLKPPGKFKPYVQYLRKFKIKLEIK